MVGGVLIGGCQPETAELVVLARVRFALRDGGAMPTPESVRRDVLISVTNDVTVLPGV
jgi:hypothetical protein